MTDSDKYRKATDMHNNSDEHLPPMNKNMEEDFNNKAVGLPSIAPSENNQTINKSDNELPLVIGRDS